MPRCHGRLRDLKEFITHIYIYNIYIYLISDHAVDGRNPSPVNRYSRFPGFYTSQVVQDCGFEAIISGSGRILPQLIDRYRML